MTAIRIADTIRACLDVLGRTPRVRELEDHAQRERVLYAALLADKNRQIADLKVRLTLAETDAQRRERVKQVVQPKPVPEFDGPISYQDQMAKMAAEKETLEDMPDGV